MQTGDIRRHCPPTPAAAGTLSRMHGTAEARDSGREGMAAVSGTRQGTSGVFLSAPCRARERGREQCFFMSAALGGQQKPPIKLRKLAPELNRQRQGFEPPIMRPATQTYHIWRSASIRYGIAPRTAVRYRHTAKHHSPNLIIANSATPVKQLHLCSMTVSQNPPSAPSGN